MIFAGIWLVLVCFGVAIATAATVFWIIEIVDVVRRQFQDPLLKIAWLLIIVFTHLIGALIYFFIGKQQGILPGEVRRI